MDGGTSSYVFLGRVGRPHGIAGELYVDRTSLTAEEWLAVGRIEWRGRGGASRLLHLREMRPTHDRLLAVFQGVRDREAAAELVNGELWGDPARLPDPGPGVMYAFQMVGFRIVDQNGAEVGVVEAFSFDGPQPLYVVDDRGRERLIPAYEPFVKKVDTAARTITVELPPGFEEI